MRILLVTPRYPPSHGGVERVVGQLAHNLAHRDHKVAVLSADGPERPAAGETNGEIEVIRHTSFHPFEAYYFSPRLARDYSSMVANFDLAHVHSLHALVSWQVLRRPVSIPVVFNPHYHATGHTHARRLLWTIAKPLRAMILDAPQRIVCVSAAEATLLTKDFPSARERVVVIPNASILERPMNRTGKDPRLILAVTRLERYKRLDLLLDAVRLLHGGFHLTIVGTGPWIAGLMKRIRNNGLEGRVEVLSDVTDAHLAFLFARANVFVSLSPHEAFGMAPLEAFRSGCHLVLPNTTPLLDFAPELREAAAFLDPSHSRPENVAEAITQAAALGEVNITESTWNWQTATSAYEKLYKELIG